MRFLVFLFFQLFLFVKCEESKYFEERFLDSTLAKWTYSSHKPEEQGKFTYEAPKVVNDEKEDFGLKTSQDARFYHISAPLDQRLSTKGKTLCVQFSVMHEQDIDCGGGYIKLLSDGFEPKEFNGETPYALMFGPDICGYGTKKVHVIFSYKGKNHLIKREIPCKSDTKTHLYTLIVKPDNTYDVLIDRQSVAAGSLTDDWDILPPKMINDPSVSKPSDWVDLQEINDPDDKKPEDWDQPKTIIDPEAKKPGDWDEEMDGEWVAPSIDNPNYKGEWSPKKIPNPEYKGEWHHPQIDNPEFTEDKDLYVMTITAIGIDLWQVKSGTIFDNMLISTDEDACSIHADAYWKKRSEFEIEEDKKTKEESKSESTYDEESKDEVPEEEESDDTSKHEEL